MSRQHLCVPVVTAGPLAIHTGDQAAGEDTMLGVSADGRPVLPGTSVAGALRAAAQRRYGAPQADALFGRLVTNESERSERVERGMLTGEPSRITVFDATASTATEGQFRHRVGIDRATQAAKRGILFDQRVWPQGLRFDLRFECDDADLGLLRGAIEELLGPAGGIGAGACPLAPADTDDETHAATIGPTTFFGAEAVAQAAERWNEPSTTQWPSTTEPCTTPAQPPDEVPGWIRIDLVFRLSGPLASRVPIDVASASEHDNVPFVVEDLLTGTPRRAVGYPGTSFKGRLRQRAEYLCAVTGRPAPDPWDTDGGAVHPVQAAFGHAPGGRAEDAAEGAAGRVRCSDLLAGYADPTHGFAPTWSEEPAEAHPLVIVRDRVAVDRLAGSTYTSAKFDDTVVRDGAWLAGTISIVPHLGEELDDTDLALVIAGLRDLATGRIGLGGSTHSGYGDVELIHGRIRERHGAQERTADLKPTVDNPVGLPQDLAQRVRDAWARTRQGAAA